MAKQIWADLVALEKELLVNGIYEIRSYNQVLMEDCTPNEIDAGEAAGMIRFTIKEIEAGRIPHRDGLDQWMQRAKAALERFEISLISAVNRARR